MGDEHLTQSGIVNRATATSPRMARVDVRARLVLWTH